MNIPNLLTILRIFFVPLLVAALVQEHVALHFRGATITNVWLALAIFLCAASTDLLDGYLARRWRQITTIGTLLDPIADKLLVSSALIALVQVRAVPAWMVILVVGREFAVSGLRAIAAAEGYTIKASDLGKTKMVSQVAAISCLLLSTRYPVLVMPGTVLMWGVVVFAMLSAFSYFRKFWRKIDSRIKKRRRRELIVTEKRKKQIALRQSGSSAGAGAEPVHGGDRFHLVGLQHAAHHAFAIGPDLYPRFGIGRQRDLQSSCGIERFSGRRGGIRASFRCGCGDIRLVCALRGVGHRGCHWRRLRYSRNGRPRVLRSSGGSRRHGWPLAALPPRIKPRTDQHHRHHHGQGGQHRRTGASAAIPFDHRRNFKGGFGRAGEASLPG